MKEETAIEMIDAIANELEQRGDFGPARFLLGAGDGLYGGEPGHPADPIYMAAFTAATPYSVLPSDESDPPVNKPLYVLRVLDGNGALTGQGEYAETPELARRLRGELRCGPGNVLALTRVERLPGFWTDKQGNEHERMGKPVVLDVEPSPGAWS